MRWISLAVMYREVSQALWFTDPDEARLFKTFADDLAWLATRRE